MDRRRVMATAVLALVLVPAVTMAQARGATGLAAQDYFEIENLIARYAHGFDSGADAGYMWADVFTPDGVFMDGSGREYRGRDAIARFGSGGPNSRKRATSVGHFITNILIEPAGAGASARSYVMIGGGGGRGRGAGSGAAAPAVPSFGMGGTYFDDLVRTPRGWRIRERVLVRPGTTVDAVRAMTARSAPEAPVTPPHADASGASASAMTLTADDYAQILQGQLADEHVVTNVLVTPVANGAVVKAYRMRAEPANGGVAIGPEGIYFAFWTRVRGAWQRVDARYFAAAADVPDDASQYVTIPGAFIAPRDAQPASPSTPTLSGDDYAAIRQLYARTAFDDDKGEPHHFVYNVRAKATADGARGEAHVVMVTLGGQGRPTTASEAGEYRDELVRTAAGWQFRSRTFTPR